MTSRRRTWHTGSSASTDAAGVNNGTDKGAAIASGNSPLFEDKDNQIIDNNKEEVANHLEIARQQVDTNPTEAQKEAGNYRHGHVVVDGLNISIENPKDSVRSGIDSDGERWETG